MQCVTVNMLSRFTTRCPMALLRIARAPLLAPHCVQAPLHEEWLKSNTAHVITVVAQLHQACGSPHGQS